MAHTSPKSPAEERLGWIKPYFQRKWSLKDIAQISPFSYRTLKRWVKAYRERGIAGLIPKSKRPHSHPKEYPQ